MRAQETPDYEWFGFCIDDTEPAYLVADISSHDDHPVLGSPLVDQADQVTVDPIDACPVTGEGDTLYWQVETWPLLFAVGEEPLPAPPTDRPTQPHSPRPARPIVDEPDFTG